MISSSRLSDDLQQVYPGLRGFQRISGCDFQMILQVLHVSSRPLQAVQVLQAMRLALKPLFNIMFRTIIGSMESKIQVMHKETYQFHHSPLDVTKRSHYSLATSLCLASDPVSCRQHSVSGLPSPAPQSSAATRRLFRRLPD